MHINITKHSNRLPRVVQSMPLKVFKTQLRVLHNLVWLHSPALSSRLFYWHLEILPNSNHSVMAKLWPWIMTENGSCLEACAVMNCFVFCTNIWKLITNSIWLSGSKTITWKHKGHNERRRTWGFSLKECIHSGIFTFSGKPIRF